MHNIATLIEQFQTNELQRLSPLEQQIFCSRLEQSFADILRPLHLLYGHRPDFQQWVMRFLEIVARAYAARPTDLRLLDLKRTYEPDWFQQAQMMGYICYVDRFAGTLPALSQKIPYLKQLGITYLHLMPLLHPRPAPNDGGYAVMDYRAVNPQLGTMADLCQLAVQLRQNGISLCTDLVLNHTAQEHEWAQKALAGDPTYQAYYWIFPDRTLPDQYERTLPEVFPDFAPGNFTYHAEIDSWVWTTFNSWQWDLNYSNPAVFAEILEIMLFLANQGVEILRLDAVAFMWKRMGSDCQNQPEAHFLLQAFRALTRVAAPGLLFKAEAIVSPPQLIPYLGRGVAANKECEIAYHNVLMVLIWSALAERKVKLMTYALERMPALPEHAAWITYIRCHDDIGWAITDEDAAAIGLNGFFHRAFLSDFYSAGFANSFARGATFQFNPKTGDRRISGSCASLAGLENALAQQNFQAINLAIGRILLAHSLIFAFGGIPLIYMGDEIGLLNDHNYLNNPDLASDNRWMHRPFMDWQRFDQSPTSVEQILLRGCQHLAFVRKGVAAFHAQARTTPVWTHNDTIFGMIRESSRGRVLILANFSEETQIMLAYRLHELGYAGTLRDHLTGQTHESWQNLRLTPYQTLWLETI